MLMIIMAYKALYQVPIKWSALEYATISSLSLPLNETNIAPEEIKLARLGQALFFDKQLSGNGNVACVTCHNPAHYFTDNQALSTAGMGKVTRNTPTVVGLADAPFLFWDGRKDSMWSQALAPLEAANEHGGDRMQYARYFMTQYPESYESLFGPVIDFSDNSRFPEHASPISSAEDKVAWDKMRNEDQTLVNHVFVNMGKAIASYENIIKLAPSRFDMYAYQLEDDLGVHQEDNVWLSGEELAGLQLFMAEDKGRCVRCHNGSAFTNHDFQATAVPSEQLDYGRIMGVQVLLQDEFNCFSVKSDQAECAELMYMKQQGVELNRAFKVPTLRNITQTAPYMHQGQFNTLSQVLDYYNRAAHDGYTHTEIEPLRLFPHELKQLESFLRALESPYANDASWFAFKRN